MGVVKAVSFKNREQELIDFVGGRDFSYYVKDLIRKDMQKTSELPSKIEKVDSKRRNVNFDI